MVWVDFLDTREKKKNENDEQMNELFSDNKRRKKRNDTGLQK